MKGSRLSLINMAIGSMFLAMLPVSGLAEERHAAVGVHHENDVARIVLMHEPGSEILYGLLHPTAALFKDSFDGERAVIEHRRFRDLLESMGVKTYLVKELLLSNSTTGERALIPEEDLRSLRRLAERSLIFDKTDLDVQFKKMRPQGRAMKPEGLRNELLVELNALKPQLDQAFLQNYKSHIIESLSPRQLVQVIFERPTIHLNLTSAMREKKVHFGVGAKYQLDPVMNMYFARDPLITTSKGVVLGRMAEHVRRPEVAIMDHALKQLNIAPLYQVKQPGILEGGDFIAAGSMVFQGIGLRTNFDAVKQLLMHDLYGADEVVVVKDIFDQDMDRMHLDTIFNVVGESKVLLWENILTDKRMRRLVDVYARQQAAVSSEALGPYVKVIADKDFGEFLMENSFQVIKVTDKEQKQFATNVLNVGNGTIVTPYKGSEYITRLSEAGIKSVFVDFENLKRGWGAAHCMTQVISREKAKRTKL
nr:arginine deiminase family protein [Nitrosomonas nitrosa]